MTKNGTKKVVFTKGERVVELTSGRTLEIAGRGKEGHMKCLTQDGAQKTVAMMKDIIDKDGVDAVGKYNKYQYARKVPGALVAVPTVDLITETEYKTALNTPENKGLIDQVKGLEKEKSAMTDKLNSINGKINEINGQLFDSIKSNLR